MDDNRITFNIPLFRERFPAFASEITYPDALLQGYFDTSLCYIDNAKAGCLSEACREQGLFAMTAHLCLLSSMITQGRGKTPGVKTGSSVGSVSVSMVAPPFGSSEWSYWLNITPYGQQFIALLSAQIAGGLYIGGRCERGAFRKVGGGF